MTPKYSPILWWPQKNIHKIFIPQKIFIFLKTPKNNEIQNFEPKKLTGAYLYMKISEYPPWGGASVSSQALYHWATALP